MGDDVPKPANDARHAKLSLALHVVGRPVSGEMPWLEGPRHCGQFCADKLATARHMAARRNSTAYLRRVSIEKVTSRDREILYEFIT
jgi:hypothetical protein